MTPQLDRAADDIRRQIDELYAVGHLNAHAKHAAMWSIQSLYRYIVNAKPNAHQVTPFTDMLAVMLFEMLEALRAHGALNATQKRELDRLFDAAFEALGSVECFQLNQTGGTKH